MGFVFVIPTKNADLLTSSGNNYCVSRLFAVGEVPDRLKAARAARNDELFIFDHFDAFYACMEHLTAHRLSVATAIRAHDMLHEAVERICRRLAVLLQQNDLPPDERLNQLNATKMLLFLLAGTMKAIDVHLNPSDAKKSGGGEGESFGWENKRREAIILVYNLMQLSIELLWDPPVVEENFVNMLCEISYRTLQLPYAKAAQTSTTVFQLLGTAIKKHNHALTFPVRILQVLEDKEYAVLPIAHGVVKILYEEFNIGTIFAVLIKDLVERLAGDANDTKVSKNFSQFLMELTAIAPHALIPHLSKLGEELLNMESHVLRNCMLQMIGNVIVSELTSEELTEELRESRDDFLQDLFDHTQDVSAHVRSKALQIWTLLRTTRNAVPLSWQHNVLRRAVERLEDKSSLVRKQAVQLIRSFLESNPFAPKLTLDELRVKYDAENKVLQEWQAKQAAVLPQIEALEESWKEIETDIHTTIINSVSTAQTQPPEAPEEIANMEQIVIEMLKEKRYKEVVELVRKADVVNAEEKAAFTFEQHCQYYLALIKSYYMMANSPPDFAVQLQQAEETVRFLLDCIDFSEIIAGAVPKLQEMLMSKTNTDVFEAIDFFTTAYLFNIKGCESGMRQMIYLVWSPDKEKRDAVVAAYKRVHFATDQSTESRGHAAKVVRNLSKFLEHLNVGHYSAFEVLIREWVESNDINHQIIQLMFERYTQKLEGTTEIESRLALQLLVLAAVANPRIVTANLNLISELGFETRGLADPRIYVSTLELIINSVEKEHEKPSKYYKRFEHDNPLVQNMITTFMRFFFRHDIDDFDAINMKTFEFIYRLCIEPDVLSQQLVFNIYERMKTVSKRLEDTTTPTPSQSLSQSQTPTGGERRKNTVSLSVPVFCLSRFIYMVGFVAMKEMIYLDIDVYSNIKFRDELRNEKKNKKRQSGGHNTSAASRRTTTASTFDMSASKALKRQSGAGDQQEMEEDLVGATADDAIAEQINFVSEEEMLYSSESLFCKFKPLILEICQSPHIYKNETLQQTSVLALIHLMSVSSRFCAEKVEFLMNLLRLTRSKRIKCNIIVGLTDLNFRFPNVIEPWTGHLYATLHETDSELRLTAVKMLSHLILHEMIRVKGQVSTLAMCLVDEVDEIRTITEQFFKEIAHKSNIIYNVLPDIISRLSAPNAALEEEKYHVIMRHIIGLIHKDRQVESLVEKLCLRFKNTYTERQWRDIAYCLSLLTYNEKTVKKLIEHVSCFKDKVQITEVYDAFKQIIAATSKLAKPEMKTLLQEFEDRLNACLSVNPDEPLPEDASDLPTTTRKVPPRTTRKAKGGKAAAHPPPRRGGRTAKKLVVTSSSDEESDSDFENQPPRRKGGAAKTAAPAPAASTTTAPTPSRSTRRQVVSKTIEDSESSESDGEGTTQRRKSARRR